MRSISLVATLIAIALVPAAANAAPKKVRIGFSSSAFSVNEADTTFNVTVVRGLNTRVAVDVDYTLDPARTTAASGVNYDFSSGTLHFAPGETRKSFPVTIHHDGVFSRPNKTVGLKLTNVVTTASVLPSSVTSTTLTILDSDGPGTIDFSQDAYPVVESAGVATITVNRTGDPLIPESVRYATSDGTATAGSDYAAETGTLTFGIGEMSKTFDVPITDDQNYEPGAPETIGLTLDQATNLNSSDPSLQPNIGPNSPATLSIQDDDVPVFSFSSPTYSTNEPSSGTSTFDVTINRGGATYVPADVVVTDLGTGSATPGTNYAAFTPHTVHFGAGDTSQPFTITLKNDATATGNETVDLGLSLNGTQVDTTQLSIVDHESTVPSVQFAAPTYSVGEAGGNATLTVSLAGPAAPGDVTVHYAMSGGSATAGSDYVATPGDLTIPHGQRTGTISVPINNDTIVEDAETFNVTLTSSDTDAVLGSPAVAKVTIVDDDSTGTLDFSASRYDVNETAGQATITVNRTGGSSGPASVDYATSDGLAHQPGDYTATHGTLNFADGETQKTLQIPVQWDGLQEGDETVNIQLSNFDSDDDPSTVKAAVLHIADDGASGPVQFDQANYQVMENAGPATITVTRSGGSLGGPVTVDYAGTDGTSGTLTFAAGEASRTFQVPVVNDNVHTGARTVSLSLSNPGGGTSLGSQAAATLTIGDDDPVSSTSKDRTPPKLKLTAKKLQRLSAKKLALKVRSNEAARLRVSLTMRKGKKLVKVAAAASKRVGAGRTVTIKLKLSAKALSKLRAALVNGKAKVTFVVTGTDVAGNRATVRKTITVK